MRNLCRKGRNISLARSYYQAHMRAALEKAVAASDGSATDTKVFADLAPTVDRLRAAVRAIVSARGRAASGARACAREFGFDKSIGWKIYQIGFAEDFVTALSAVPGTRGWEIVLGKFAAARVPDAQVAEVKHALEAFEKQLADRHIDRKMLSGMAAAAVDTDESRRQMLRLRKQASDAMAVILGVHANSRLGAYLVVPSKTQGMVDLAAVTMLDGLERRRSGPPFEMYFPIRSYDADAKWIDASGGPLVDSPRAPLVAELSSMGISEQEVGLHPTIRGAHEFVGRSPSRQEPLHVSFGEYALSVGPECQRGSEKTAELAMPVLVPTTVAVLDILLHRDIRKGGELRAELYSAGATRVAGAVRERRRLALESRVLNSATLHFADISTNSNTTYAELCKLAAVKLGYALTDFEIHRVVVPHPPVPCSVMMTWQLAASL